MKRTLLFTTFGMMALLLSSCASPASAASAGQVLSYINTAVAMTVTAQTSSATATPIPNGSYYAATSNCNNSSFIKDVTFPDETVVSPGEEFVKTWRLENTGNCAWNSGYSLVFVSGYRLAGSTTYIAETVDVGKKADVSVDLVAPDTDGTYYGYWTLADDSGYTFGDTVYVEIVVYDTATATPTATSTSTPTPTSTSSFPTPTSTSAPTASATATGSTTAEPSSTFTASPTSSVAATNTAAPTSTPTQAPRATATGVATATTSPAATATATTVPTSTVAPTATSTPKPDDMH